MECVRSISQDLVSATADNYRVTLGVDIFNHLGCGINESLVVQFLSHTTTLSSKIHISFRREILYTSTKIRFTANS